MLFFFSSLFFLLRIFLPVRWRFYFHLRTEYWGLPSIRRVPSQAYRPVLQREADRHCQRSMPNAVGEVGGEGQGSSFFYVLLVGVHAMYGDGCVGA
jgi:hypothetical protein